MPLQGVWHLEAPRAIHTVFWTAIAELAPRLQCVVLRTRTLYGATNACRGSSNLKTQESGFVGEKKTRGKYDIRCLRTEY